MTTTEPEAPDADTDEFERLGKQLLRMARSTADRAAIQALIEERTILSMPAVRHALVDDGRRKTARFEGLSGRQYTLGLDRVQHVFLDLVLSMVSVGRTNICVVQDLDDRRLQIMLRAILRLAGNDDIAVGRRL